MRLLVLGGAGMLGHKLWQTASPHVETWATVRRVTPALTALGLGDPARTIEGVDVRRPGDLDAALDRARPDAVVNCVGVVKQLAAANDPVESIAINALHPHVLARACHTRGIRLVHISTDCVFDGARGSYREDDVANATDLYGRSKALGEVIGPRLPDGAHVDHRPRACRQPTGSSSGSSHDAAGPPTASPGRSSRESRRPRCPGSCCAF